MTARKYELTDDSKTIDGTTLRRIRAVTSFGSFGSVCAGDLGGYVETENNLSQEGNAWVFDDAQVFYRARVFGEALAFGDARITGPGIRRCSGIWQGSGIRQGSCSWPRSGIRLKSLFNSTYQ